MKRKKLLSFLGIIACLLLSAPVLGEDSWKDKGEVKDDGITVHVHLNIRTDNDKTMTLDLNDTRATNILSVKDTVHTAYLSYEVWDGENWKEQIAYFYGTFDRACINHDNVYPYVCQDARDSLGYGYGGVMAITKPAGDESVVGTIKVTNSVLSKYYATVQWGWNGLSTKYSQANGFTQHCLNYDTRSKGGAYDTNFYIDIDWELPSSLAGKQLKIKFHKGQWYRDRSINNTTGSTLVEFTRAVKKSDFWCLASLSGGKYSGIKKVELKEMHVSGAKIYYTLDGSTPTTSSTEYTGPIAISKTTTLKYMPVYNNVKGSVMTETYIINPTEYVDLGLPSGTLWATKNVGAESPEKDGDYFAWGEVEPKDTYTEDNYKWGKKGAYTKYQTNGGRYELEVQDDAASMNWGAQWHMPTKAQIEELGTYCTYSSTTLDGVRGVLYTSKQDVSKSVFIPRAGSKRDNQYVRASVNLYSKERSTSSSGEVWYVIICDDCSGAIEHQDWDANYRHWGMPVRPVMNPGQPVNELVWISGMPNKTEYIPGESFDVSGLEVNYLPIESSAEKVSDSITWSVEPAVIYCGCKSVTVKATYNGVTSEPMEIPITSGAVSVDLGLSVKWSSFNIGAIALTDAGNYYTCDDIDIVENIEKVLGSGWRLPTEAEVKELQDTTKCTWVWYPAGNSENGGVAGYRVFSKSTGNFIFLPAAGCHSGSNIVGKGSVGNYWTSAKNGSEATYMCFDAYDRCLGTDHCSNGRVIRVVKK